MAGLLYSNCAAAKLRSGLTSTVPESAGLRHPRRPCSRCPSAA